jgi:hypothetical protein
VSLGCAMLATFFLGVAFALGATRVGCGALALSAVFSALGWWHQRQADRRAL